VFPGAHDSRRQGPPLQESVVLDDETETLVKLFGRRVIPILIKDDGQPMLESMDMVKYIESQRQPILVGPERPEVAAWAEHVIAKTGPLTMPRYPLLGLPEFATVAALDH
jgi:glutaredoxin 2